VRAPSRHEVGGYILAGGKSSRMGRDKALIELAGKPLIEHAVKKLRRVCVDVRLLTNNQQLETFAPIVQDIHPGCGPMSGMEAGLQHSIFEWNLFLAVDMPFVPATFLFDWLGRKLWANESSGLGRARVQMFEDGGTPQPALCLLHKDVAPFLTAAIERGDYKLVPVLRAAGQALAEREGFLPGRGGFFCLPLVKFQSERSRIKGGGWRAATEAPQRGKRLWFANLNTQEEFAEAERHVDALDT
jgi:molybdenum cofactor guanylyltransferase